MPLDQWPEPLLRSFNHINEDVYVPMQGPSEFGIRGMLEKWDRTIDLPQVEVPTLAIGGRYDTMNPEHMKWVATQVQHGEFLLCPEGSHCSYYDDQETYFNGLISFIKKIDSKK